MPPRTSSDVAFSAHALAFVMVASGAAILALAALGGPRGGGLDGLIATGAAALVTGLALATAADRVPAGMLGWLAAWATALAAAAVHFRAAPVAAYALLCLGPALYACSFLSPAAALGVLTATTASLGVALGVFDRPPADAIELWLATCVALGVCGGSVWLMRRRYDRALARLSSAARTDPLTGLLNRRGFEEAFELELERSRRSGVTVSVLVGDLDGFKLVNDRHGHKEGDSALERVSAILRRRKRRIDSVGRLGGEEFAVVVPDTNDRHSFMLAERLRSAVADEFAADPVPLTISFGVATYPAHGDSCEALLGAADDALYAAKTLGRDRTVIFSRQVPEILAPTGARGHQRDEHLATLLALAETVDRRETPLGRHSASVGRYAAMTALELGLPPETVERVRLAATLHDVGKIALPDPLLTKPAPLDEREWAEVRRHPEVGAHMLANAHLPDLGRWVAAHHERPDGQGFPQGLANGDIPLEARIIAVADAYEAMTSDRPYRRALPPAHARAELRSNARTQFDERVVRAFLTSLEREESAA